MKPIYKREIWGVMEKVAKELRYAYNHEPNPQTKEHLDRAIKEIDDFVIRDMKCARKEQRRLGRGTMGRIIAVLMCLSVLCSGCTYLSSNIIKMRGDEIKGHFASTPVNLTGKNIVVTIYREMILSLQNLKPRFINKITIENDREKGDIKVDR